MIIYFMLNLKQGTESSVFFNVIIMYMKNAQNVPSVHEPAEDAKRRTTDVVKKHGMALSVERKEEERKAFERMVDEACEKLNNFKVPKRKSRGIWLFVLLLVVLAGGGYLLWPKGHASDEETVLKEQMQEEQARLVTEKEKALQLDMAMGLSRGAALCKQNILAAAKAEVARTSTNFAEALKVCPAQLREVDVSTLNVDAFKHFKAGLLAQKRSYLEKSIGQSVSEGSYREKLRHFDRDIAAVEKAGLYYGKWQDAERRLAETMNYPIEKWEEMGEKLIQGKIIFCAFVGKGIILVLVMFFLFTAFVILCSRN